MFNYRGSLIKSLIEKGYQVSIVAPFDDYAYLLSNLGVDCHDVEIIVKKNGIINDFKTLWQYFKIYREIRPNLIFHYTIKPAIYGTLAARLLGVKSIIVMTGLGYSFVQDNLITKLARQLLKLASTFSSQFWILNQDDKDEILKRKIVSPKKIFNLGGEGIDLNYFKPILKKRNNPFQILHIGRLMGDKGVNELVEVAKKRDLRIEITILGKADFDSPDSISLHQAQIWQKEGIIKYILPTMDVRPYIANSDCIVLASYREGMSRTLMEAVAMGKPIIASNVGGCKEFVEEGKNGFLITPGDVEALYESMIKLSDLNDEKLLEMSKRSRKIAEENFDERFVIDKYLKNIEKQFI